jgi:hypothetical protein
LDRIGEGRVEIVDDLGEAIGRLLVASIVNEEDLDIPALHRKSFHLRRLVT